MSNSGPFLSGEDRVSFKFHTVKLTIGEAAIIYDILGEWAHENREEAPYVVEVLGNSLYNAVRHYEKSRH